MGNVDAGGPLSGRTRPAFGCNRPFVSNQRGSKHIGSAVFFSPTLAGGTPIHQRNHKQKIKKHRRFSKDRKRENDPRSAGGASLCDQFVVPTNERNRLQHCKGGTAALFLKFWTAQVFTGGWGASRLLQFPGLTQGCYNHTPVFAKQLLLRPASSHPRPRQAHWEPCLGTS